ncbi:inositol monophosphatase family protein [Nocardia africana]|uniref:Inositol monophosphatase family protein n=1 Tax=Nocardia africana TaxID=134964 RepID=A0ABW6NCL0_9NOCA
MITDTDIHDLLAIASEVLDAAAPRFAAGLGLPGRIEKSGNDFATPSDLELERTLSTRLHSQTGIPVHGEEFGGPELTSGTVWVLDPIDGTFNYSAGSPLSGILLALLHDSNPVLGLTWLPLLDYRYTAVRGGPLALNGKPVPALQPTRLADTMIGFSTFNLPARSPTPDSFRFDLVSAAGRRSLRLRMHGSTGIDLAFTASGVLGGAVALGSNAWDNAAGVAQLRSAGAIVTDIVGQPWTITSNSLLAGAPGVHDELLRIVQEIV